MSLNENQSRYYSTDFFETFPISNLPPGVYRHPIYKKSWTERTPIDRRLLANNAVDQSIHLPKSTNMNHERNFEYIHHPNTNQIIDQYDPTSQDLESPQFTEQYLRELDAERVELLAKRPIQTNTTISYDIPHTDIVNDVRNLGIVRIDPNEYAATYGPELVSREYMREMMARLGIDNDYTEMQAEPHPSSLMNPNQYKIVDSPKKSVESNRYPMADEIDSEDLDTADEEVRQLTANGIKKG